MTRELAGSIAGFLATAPMTLAMQAMHKALPEPDKHPLPPRHVTENAAASVGVDLGPDESTHRAATLAAHFSYGASTGALYSKVAGVTGLSPAVEGMLFGVAVWAGSYLGLLPGAGLYPSAEDESAPRNALMIGAHLVWGASLGVLMHTLPIKDSGEI